MSEHEGIIRDLGQGGKESLRALIQAIAPETKTGDGETLNRLTDKLSEIVGADTEGDFQQQRNERGELVNEEGLPIIDITEPVDNVPKTRSSASLPPPVTVEPLIKLSSLPETARARLKEQQDRILDLLEEEETRLEQQEKEREEQSRRDALQQKHQDAARDKERAKEARELQKKMGRALLKNVNLSREKEREDMEAQRLQDEEKGRQNPTSAKKKTVAFADSIQDSEAEDQTRQENWGDIIPATLRGSKQPSLISNEKQPMKMTVVERAPGSKPPTPKPHLFQDHREPDSDDESDPEPIDSSDDDDNYDDDPQLEADEMEYDYAQQQREIALEYFKKRDSIGQAAAEALKNHTHDDDVHPPTENPDVIKDSPTPVISQFRATRLAEAYQSSGHKPKTADTSSSLGDAVLSASGARTIQRSIRTGKVDADGNLIGGEADSASENEDDQLQEVLNLIKKGEVLNVGPNNEYLTTIPPKNDPWQKPAAPSSTPTPAEKPSELPPPTIHSKVSKFKVSRAAAGRPTPPIIPDLKELAEIQSMSSTPVSHAPRSSPKITTPIDEKNPELLNTIQTPQPHTSSVLPPQFSMIVESPDFPRPSHIKERSAPVAPTAVRERKPPTVAATGSRRPERPPMVLSTKVVESQNRQAESQITESEESSAPKKVSRFKQERM